ncbi:TetR/AcrR family transcriptional regulator [Taklimakanibacter deserti]|uniref:TetR/AcrR family transcriptional regulator n=1 Tax=Taklimakanibacter deserti TaxID=2267839 RepID=UPI000E65B895
MARPRAFDPAATLRKAMMVFWERGYFNSSIDDIVAATGVSRYGLYDIHENKRGLFLAALDHYYATIFEPMLAPVTKPDAGLAEIRDYFGVLLHYARKPGGGIGCLMCNSASEVAPFDRDVAARVRNFQDNARQAFRRALVNARRKGEIGQGIDPARHADFLTGALQTVWLLARSSAGSKVIANHIAVTLATLDKQG